MLIHSRFSPEVLPSAVEWISKTPRYLIGEEVGGLTKKLHYHAVFESSVGIEAIKKRFQTTCKALGLVSGKGQENAHYGGVKPADNLGFAYAAKHGKVTHSAGFTPEEITETVRQGKARFLTPIVAASPASPDGDGLKAGTVLVMRKKPSESMRSKFVRHMNEKKGWILHDHIHLDDNYLNLCEQLEDELTEFWENAFTTIQGAVCIEHAKWMFGDDDIKDDVKANNRRALYKILR